MTDVTRRMLDLLATLQTGRSFSGGELASRLGVSPRTLRRDVDRLRGYGYPVDTRPGPGGHYRLTSGTALPPLMLGDDEAIATLLGLASLAATGSAAAGSLDQAATRAYGKVEQYLPKRLRHRVAGVRSSLETGRAPGPSAATDVLAAVAEAIGGRRIVAFDYERGDGARAERRVEPHRQIHHLQRWYLLGWDLDRRDWRVFRLDRVAGLRTSTSTFTPRTLPAASAVDYLDQGMRRERSAVTVTVAAPVARVADTLRYESVELEAVGERRTRVVLHTDTWEWLLVALAFLDADFTVAGPPAFEAALARFADRLARSGERRA